jgi:hypothetical protein
MFTHKAQAVLTICTRKRNGDQIKETPDKKNKAGHS